MERHEYFDDWDTGKADLGAEPEEPTGKCKRCLESFVLDDLSDVKGQGLLCLKCRCPHESLRSELYDFGVCRETGYRDAGERITCLDCSEVFDAEEYRWMRAEQQAECVRCGSQKKTVQTDRLVLGTPDAVCCQQAEVA